MAITYVSNLVIYTGTDFDQTFVLEDAQSNSVKDLTGFNGCAQMKRYESSLKTADFTVSFANDRATGRVTLSLLASDSINLKPGKYFYDLILNSPTGSTTRAVEGTVLVKKSVTR
tara:strand:- start:4884 stop:5228 length:345 start_codon:yes stop_codon:yes gene_type:complete